MTKSKKSVLTKIKYSIDRVENPTEKITHVLWRYTESLSGSGYKGIWHGSYDECVEKRKELLKKPKRRGIKAWILDY